MARGSHPQQSRDDRAVRSPPAVARSQGRPRAAPDVGETSLIFFQRNEKPGKTPIVVFGLDDGGIDNIVEELARRGANIVVPVSHAPGGWSADFLDPDGHTWSMYQSNKAPRRL